MTLTQPAGTEPPDILDDAIREVKTVLSAVTKKAHTSTGSLRFARWTLPVNAGINIPTTGAAGAWQRLGLTTIHDTTGLLLAGTFTSSIKPIAGTYLARFGVTGSAIDKFMGRLAIAIGNATAPSAATDIPQAYTPVGDSPAIANPSTIQLHGAFVITTAGATDFCLDQIYQTANAVSGFGKTHPGGGAWPGSYVPSYVDFFKLA